METNPLRTRGIALEEVYIRQVEAERLRRSRAENGRRALRAELGAELELEPEEDALLLDELIEQGISADTAPAFEALPLVEVAWADGDIDAEERWRVLGVATAFGLELGRPAHAQLELWLTRRPPEKLIDAWYRFAELALASPAAAARAQRVIEGAQEVALAAGGLLGLGAISGSERATIARIRHALGRAPGGPSWKARLAPRAPASSGSWREGATR